MAHLIADSTNRVTYVPAVDLDTLTLGIAKSNGSAVAYAGTLAESAGVWTLDLTSGEIDAALLYDTLTFTWTLTYTSGSATQVRTDIEYFDVLEQAERDRLITIRDVKNHLGINDDSDDEFISGIIDQALLTLSSVYDLPTVPKTSEARYVTVRSDKLVLLDECVSITSIVDDSATLVDPDYYTLLYGKTASDMLRGFILEVSYRGQLTVTGVWGYDDCPADVRRAMLITVSTWYKRARHGDGNDIVGNLSTLPKEARDLMDARMPVSV